MTRTFTLVLSFWVLLGARVARADHDPNQRGFDAVPVKATPAGESGISLEGGQTPPVGSYRFGALFDLNVGILALKLGQEKIGELIPFRTDLRLLAAYQLHRRLELAVDLPVTLYQASNFQLLTDRGFPQNETGRMGLGDVRALARASILDQESFPLALAAIGEVRLPTGDGQSFLGDTGVVFAPRLAVERGIGPIRLLGNVGYRLRPHHAQFLNLFVSNEFTLGAGAIFGLPDFWRFTEVKAVGEMLLATPLNAPFTFSQADSLKTPWDLLVGVRAKFYRNWGAELDIGRGLGLVTGYGRQTLRVLLGIRYDFTFQDRDGDRVPDDVDACPDVPEDRDGFEDGDGCPDPDNDQDGVPDTEDGCPMDPGPREFDGCPDRDGDQIPDNVDKCPDEPGPPEEMGCPVKDEPQVVLESDRIRLRGNILFETGEATIQTQSYGILDEVYTVLSEHPEIGPVLIEGHTDNRGSRAYNQQLSERRAKAVVDYLVKKGIDRKRLKSRGYGFDRPVADNATPLGRAKNRRTEFKLVDDEPEPKGGKKSDKKLGK